MTNRVAQRERTPVRDDAALATPVAQVTDARTVLKTEQQELLALAESMGARVLQDGHADKGNDQTEHSLLDAHGHRRGHGLGSERGEPGKAMKRGGAPDESGETSAGNGTGTSAEVRTGSIGGGNTESTAATATLGFADASNGAWHHGEGGGGGGGGCAGSEKQRAEEAVFKVEASQNQRRTSKAVHRTGRHALLLQTLMAEKEQGKKGRGKNGQGMKERHQPNTAAIPALTKVQIVPYSFLQTHC